MREGALLRELKGEPGILTLHAAFESAREVWLVVELAQTTLGAVAKARGGVPEATLRPWAIDVVLHSPTPSIVTIVASANGDG